VGSSPTSSIRMGSSSGRAPKPDVINTLLTKQEPSRFLFIFQLLKEVSVNVTR